jgi:tetratricopeptide (TPR) repeat protein
MVGRRRALVVVTMIACGAALAGGAGTAYARHRGPMTSIVRSMPTRPPMPEAAIRDSDIAFYEARAGRDPTGATDLARAARLYLQRARETGNYDDVLRAEADARRSISNRAGHNATAAQVLASALLSEHRFADAQEVARGLVASDPTHVSYRAALGEIEFELGRYADARATFDSLRAFKRELSVTPRLARWEELTGHTDAARHLLHLALEEAERRTDLPQEQVAWFWLRLGDLELRAGRPDVASFAYGRGLRAHPEDYRLLAAVAHLDAVQHDWRGAVEAGERAIAANLDPATLGTISDAYAALGDTGKAAEYARVLEVAVSKQPGAYHRAWSLFLLDHDRRVAEVLSKAGAELQTRQDIYGYDVLAWALYKNGRARDAERPMTHALSLGTQDAMLFYHAGMIARAVGRPLDARAYLDRALAINPSFHPTQPDSARVVLQQLREQTLAADRSPVQ